MSYSKLLRGINMGLHDGHRERMLSKFSKSGFAGLEEHEKLEIILFFSVPRINTNEVAHQMLNKYHTIAGVMDAPPEELVKFKGITKRTVQLFKLIRETYSLYILEKNYESSFLTTEDEFAAYFIVAFAAAEKERLVMMSLDSRGKRLGVDIIGEGGFTELIASPKSIIQLALDHRAIEVVLCHNHPGGIAYPSEEDIASTERIKGLLNAIGVHLKDHYIVTKCDYIAMSKAEESKHLFVKEEE